MKKDKKLCIDCFSVVTVGKLKIAKRLIEYCPVCDSERLIEPAMKNVERKKK